MLLINHIPKSWNVLVSAIAQPRQLLWAPKGSTELYAGGVQWPEGQPKQPRQEQNSWKGNLCSSSLPICSDEERLWGTREGVSLDARSVTELNSLPGSQRCAAGRTGEGWASSRVTSCQDEAWGKSNMGKGFFLGEMMEAPHCFSLQGRIGAELWFPYHPAEVETLVP